MHILITGAAGFVGNKLARELLRRFDAAELTKLTLTDVVEPSFPDDQGHRVHPVKADLLESAGDLVLSQDVDVIYCLHGIMSGQSESEFELGTRVNLDATRALLDAVRADYKQSNKTIKFIYSSSIAVYGGDVPEPITEMTQTIPQSSYGTQKAVCELLINDLSRRGLLDGRILRLPTVSVRPGKPSAAASSYVSGIVREPLQRIPHKCPVDRKSSTWICRPATMIKNLVHAMGLDASRFGCTRVVNLPGIVVTVEDQIEALRQVDPKSVELISFEHDEQISNIVKTWRTALDPSRALQLGFQRDRNFREAIDEFVQNELPKPIK